MTKGDPLIPLTPRTALWARYAGLFPPFMVVIVYMGAIGGGFGFDDSAQIVTNPWLKDPLWGIKEAFTSAVNGFASGPTLNYYRPLMHLMNILVYQTVGLNAAVFHGVNVALHALASLLVFILCSEIYGRSKGNNGTLAAFVAALLFALHPVNVEPVAWIAGSPDPLFTLLGLGTILLYARLPLRRKKPVSPGSLALFFLALLSKETAAILLPLLISYDLFCRSERAPYHELLLRMLPYGLVFAGYLCMRVFALGALAPEGSGIIDNVSIQLSAMAQSLGWHLWRAFLPAGYTFGSELALSGETTLTTSFAIGTLATFTGLVTFCFWRHARALWFSLVLALPLLMVALPATSLKFPLADRYLYFPSIGVCGLVGYMVLNVNNATVKRAFLAGVGLIAITWAWSAVQTVSIVANPLSFWANSISQGPYMPWPTSTAKLKLTLTEADIALLQELIKEDRLIYSYPKNVRLIASIRLDQEQPGEALRFARAGLAVDPQNPRIRFLEGVALSGVGDVEGAVKSEIMAMSGNLKDIRTVETLSFNSGLDHRALPYLKLYLAQEPTNAAAHLLTGDVYRREGSLRKAISHYLEAARLGGNGLAAHHRIGTIFEIKGDMQNALKAYETAISHFPEINRWRNDYSRVEMAIRNQGRQTPF